MKSRFKSLYVIIVSLCVLTACSVNKFIPEGHYLLDKVTVRSDNKLIKTEELNPYLRQNSNARWFNIFRFPMYIYGLSGRDSTNGWNKFLRKIGDKPIIYDAEKAEETRVQLLKATQNKGFMGASVDLYEKKKKNHISILYKISAGKPYLIDSVKYQIDDDRIANLLLADTAASYLKPGVALDVNKLDEERQRMAEYLQVKGYYGFNKEYISYEADTLAYSKRVGLIVRLDQREDSLMKHQVYGVRSVNFLLDTEYADLPNLSNVGYHVTNIDGVNVYYRNKLFLRKQVLRDVNFLRPGTRYNYDSVRRTYTALGRLGILKFYNIRFAETLRNDSAYLDAYLLLSRNKNKSMAFEVEGTNSAGDFGAAASVAFSHRNLFRGSETFMMKFRGAYEAVTGLEGYANSNYKEYAIESSLNFPQFVFPFLSDAYKRSIRATSELGIKYDWQIRPEFSRTVASASWSYKWNQGMKRNHRLDLLDINYIYMPFRSQTFSDYLTEMDEVNPLLRYSYEDQFIIRMGYTYTYNSAGGPILRSIRRNSYSFRFNIEESGNLMYLFSRLVNKQPRYGNSFRMGNIYFAQYMKADVDFAKNYFIDERNSIVFHVGVGVAYPYGNSKSLPFEKLYFSGGANSVRGWGVRSLGPGGYVGLPNRLDYVNHTGDLKLDLNLEYRTHLFWKLNGAAFIDAGNIWNLRTNALQRDGLFKPDRFYRQIAVAYGLGIRFDFDFLILRLDGGMKAVNPMYEGKDHYPLLSPNMKRDFAFHFAVGYPF